MALASLATGIYGTTCTLDSAQLWPPKMSNRARTQHAYHMQHEPIIKGLGMATSIGGSQKFVFGHVLFQTSDNPQYSFLKGFLSKQRSSRCIFVCVKPFIKHPEGHNSVSELFRQFLWPHDSHLLWHALWAVRSYIDRCVAFLIESNQYNQTQLDSNEGVEPSQGWSEEMDRTWVKYMSVTAKGLRTMWYFSFSFLINLQKCQQFCVFLSIWGAVCTLMRKKMNLNDFSKWLQYNKEWKM